MVWLMFYAGCNSSSASNYFDQISGSFPRKGNPSVHSGPVLAGGSASLITHPTLPLSSGSPIYR